MSLVTQPESLSDFDLHLLAEGKHYRTFDKLGAHLCVVNGVRGVYLKRRERREHALHRAERSRPRALVDLPNGRSLQFSATNRQTDQTDLRPEEKREPPCS